MGWYPACTGCLPLTHSLDALNSWHWCCTASVQAAMCSHTHGLNTAAPQKSSPTKAWGQPSASTSSPRCIGSPLAVTWDKGQAPSPAKWLNCFKKEKKSSLKKLGKQVTEQVWFTDGILFQRMGHKEASWRETIC